MCQAIINESAAAAGQRADRRALTATRQGANRRTDASATCDNRD
jgi:hypothetical protein